MAVTSGGLQHLVAGAVTAFEKVLGEEEGEIVEDFSLLVGQESFEITTRLGERAAGWLGRLGVLGQRVNCRCGSVPAARG